MELTMSPAGYSGPQYLDRTNAESYSFPVSGAGITQLAECQLPKLNVAGSIPVTRSILLLTLLILILPSPSSAQGTGFSSDFWLQASGSGLAADSFSVSNLSEVSLKNQLRNGNRSALVPLIRLLVSRGRPDEAAVWMEGRGRVVPVTRRDLAIALSWYGRFELYEILSNELTVPPDLQDDDYGNTIAAVLEAGWMKCSQDGWFHPDLLAGRIDIMNLSGVFFPPGISWDRDWIGMKTLDSLFAEGIARGMGQ
jgi:hypothetical protein